MGKWLVLQFFLVSGLVKLAEPSLFSPGLIRKYSLLSVWLGNLAPVSDAWMAQNSIPIIYIAGALTLLGAILSLVGLRGGIWLLSFILTVTTFFINNPFAAVTEGARVEETTTVLVHLAVLGGLLGALDEPKDCSD
jgi:hypothetical protein